MNSLDKSLERKINLILSNRGSEGSEDINHVKVFCDLHEVIERLEEENSKFLDQQRALDLLQDHNNRLLKENTELRKRQHDLDHEKEKVSYPKSHNEDERLDYIVCLKEQLRLCTRDFVQENRDRRRAQKSVIDLQTELLKIKNEPKSSSYHNNKNCDEIVSKHQKKRLNENKRVDKDRIENKEDRTTQNSNATYRINTVNMNDDILSAPLHVSCGKIQCPSCFECFDLKHYTQLLSHIENCSKGSNSRKDKQILLPI